MTGIWLNRISRGLSRPPGELARRLAMEGRAFLERFQGPPAGPLDEAGLWERLGARPSPWFTRPVDTSLYETHCPGDGERILAAADAAIEGRIDLLGSGPVQLSRPLPWPEDFKTGLAWPHKFHRDIDVNDFSRPSDVKLPWEFSRLQWALPAGQAYLLKGEARYAEFVRALLEEWIKANPYGRGVNWTSAMEASMRIFVWVWFFHVFHQAPAWQDESFRNDFLISLYRHGVYVSRYLEDFGLNGNHCVADGAGLVVAGLFFGEGGKPASWVAQGWRVLEREMFRQTHPDGVDFEASTFYHRLVAELFLLPMAYRRVLGMEVPGAMDERLALMGEFADSYMAGQAAAPLWGDGDDGRVLPFGGQAVGDHNYLGPLIRNYLGDGAPVSPELFWLSGPPAASGIEGKPTAPSRAFAEGGVYIMTGPGDRVFIDCGPVGFGGRGGHGHNDCLSVDLVLDNTALLSDCGSFVYTASPGWRNRLRATNAHNTPQIDSAEQNRFVAPNELFRLHEVARPEPRFWRVDEKFDYFEGAYSGHVVRPVRRMILDRAHHRLAIEDRFEGQGSHRLSVPYHLAPGVDPERLEDGIWRLRAGEKSFLLHCPDIQGFTATERPCWISPSYGVKLESRALEFNREGALARLRVLIYPENNAPKDVEVCFNFPA